MTHPPMGRQLSDRAAAHPDAPAVTCGGVTLTYAELDRRANRLARAYAGLGVRQGDLVTLALPNGSECVLAAWAAWKLGATPQPVSHRLPAVERDAIIALARPSLVVGVEVQPGFASVPAGWAPDPGLSDAPLPDAVSPIWKAMTSGGSTGRPKLILATSTSELDPDIGALLKLEEGDVALAPGPLFHNTPFLLCHGGLLLGCHIVLMDRFTPEATIEAVETHRVQVLSLVPTMMLRILRHLEEQPRTVDWSSVRVLWHMAAPCAEWLKRAWMDIVGPERLWELYGGTELVSITTVNGTEWLERPGTVGRPVLGEMTILGPDGSVLPYGEHGDIYMRTVDGSSTFTYVGAEATVTNGWTTLGDIGRMDADGFVYLSDRRTDMINVGGENVYPAEVEAAIMEHPDVLCAVAVGLPDADLGQRVHAVVETPGGLTEDDLRAYVADRLVRYKQPRSYRFTTTTLRDDAGKVRRSLVRASETERGLSPDDGDPAGA